MPDPKKISPTYPNLWTKQKARDFASGPLVPEEDLLSIEYTSPEMRMKRIRVSIAKMSEQIDKLIVAMDEAAISINELSRSIQIKQKGLFIPTQKLIEHVKDTKND